MQAFQLSLPFLSKWDRWLHVFPLFDYQAMEELRFVLESDQWYVLGAGRRRLYPMLKLPKANRLAETKLISAALLVLADM